MVLKSVPGTSANHYKVDHLDDLTATVVTNPFRSGDPTRRWKAVRGGSKKPL